MESDESVESDGANVRDRLGPDSVLGFLVHLANASGLEMGVILTLAGQAISGTIVSGERYFRELADALQGQAPSDLPDSTDSPDATRVAIARWLRNESEGYKEAYAADDDGGELPELTFVHLRDASLSIPGAPLQAVGLWRGRLDEVSGWTLGNFTPAR